MVWRETINFSAVLWSVFSASSVTSGTSGNSSSFCTQAAARVDLLALVHVPVPTHQARPRPAAAAVDLAALDCNHGFGRACRSRRRSSWAAGNILRSTVGKTSLSAPTPVAPMMNGFVRMSCQDLMRRLRGRRNADLVGDAAEPIEFHRVILRAFAAPEQRIEEGAARKSAKGAPSFGAIV